MQTYQSWQYVIPAIAYFAIGTDTECEFSVASYERKVYDITTKGETFTNEELEFIFDGMKPYVSADINFRLIGNNILEFLRSNNTPDSAINEIESVISEPLPRKWVFDFEYAVWPVLRNIILEARVRGC